MMRTSSLALFVSILLASSAKAADAFGNGNAWVAVCAQPANPSPYSFASGVAGGMTWFKELKPICLRKGVLRQQLGAIFCNYLEKHPEQWDSADVLIAGKALEEAFPCEQ